MRRRVRLLLVLLLVLLTLAAAVALSIPIDAYLNRDRVGLLTNALAPGAAPVAMYRALPREALAGAEGPFPAVVMIHEFWGLNESLLGKADALATEGYVVVAPDTLRGNATRWFPRALYQSITASAERVSTDLDSVLRALRSDPLVDPQRIAVMGFCFGGTQALAYSLSRPDAVAATAVFYGSVGDDAEALARLRGPVLGIFGESDHLIPLTSVAAFEGALMASGTPHRIEVFPEVGHAFVTSVEGIASDPIQAAAWGMLRDFLAETLGRAE